MMWVPPRDGSALRFWVASNERCWNIERDSKAQDAKRVYLYRFGCERKQEHAGGVHHFC